MGVDLFHAASRTDRHADVTNLMFIFLCRFVSISNSETALFGPGMRYCNRYVSTSEALKVGISVITLVKNSLRASDRGIIFNYHNAKTPALNALKQQ